MNTRKKEFLRNVGFEQEVDAIEQGQCPFCRKTIDIAAFADASYVREFQLSGLCQECQDSIFS